MPLRLALQSEAFISSIFFGPPGCGKTAMARVIANEQKLSFQAISCVVHGISKIREALNQATLNKQIQGKPTLLVLDEIHHLNRTQQDILLPYMENGDIVLIGLTTENPFFYIHKAIISRALVFEFKSLPSEELAIILDRSLDALKKDKKQIHLEPEAENFIIAFAAGDARKLLNALEFLANLKPTRQTIKAEDLKSLLGKKQLLYDKKEDFHYDMASAFIKSMRGSDPDAAIYWMTRMLEAGEDPRFIARRILICASEDVGNADPRALILAQSTFAAIEMLGLPEGAIPLAQATLYVAGAPKSNASYLALHAAQEEVKNGAPREVPPHLKDSNLDSSLGHGEGYKYSHDYPEHFADQAYMPNPEVFYRPTLEGYEAKIKERLEKLWRGRYVKSEK